MYFICYLLDPHYNLTNYALMVPTYWCRHWGLEWSCNLLKVIINMQQIQGFNSDLCETKAQKWMICPRPEVIGNQRWSTWCVCHCERVLSGVWLFVTPQTVARQVPLSMESPGKNAGVGCHFLLQGIFPTQGSNPHLLQWPVDSSTQHHLGGPLSGLRKKKYKTQPKGNIQIDISLTAGNLVCLMPADAPIS